MFENNVVAINMSDIMRRIETMNVATKFSQVLFTQGPSTSLSLHKRLSLIHILTHADSGAMFLLGHAVPRHRDVALARVAAIVDEPRFHGHLTGRQNLQILAAAREPVAKGCLLYTSRCV